MFGKGWLSKILCRPATGIWQIRPRAVVRQSSKMNNKCAKAAIRLVAERLTTIGRYVDQFPRNAEPNILITTSDWFLKSAINVRHCTSVRQSVCLYLTFGAPRTYVYSNSYCCLKPWERGLSRSFSLGSFERYVKLILPFHRVLAIVLAWTPNTTFRKKKIWKYARSWSAGIDSKKKFRVLPS